MPVYKIQSCVNSTTADLDGLNRLTSTAHSLLPMEKELIMLCELVDKVSCQGKKKRKNEFSSSPAVIANYAFCWHRRSKLFFAIKKSRVVKFTITM